MRKFTFFSISNLFEGNTIVEEIYLPEICSKNWKSLGYMLNGCIRLRKLVFPKDHNLDLYMELPEQEALELQEKYNIENGNYYNNR